MIRRHRSFVVRLCSGGLGFAVAGSLLGCGSSPAPDASPHATQAPPEREFQFEEPPDPAAARPPLDARCEALCNRYRACGAVGAADCLAECQRRSQQEHEHQRPSYLWRLISCFEGIACEPLMAGGAERACGEIARRQLTPSKVLERFCSASAARASQCGYPADQSDCLDRFRSSDDASLAEASRCIDRPCADVPTCFARALGFAPPPSE